MKKKNYQSSKEININSSKKNNSILSTIFLGGISFSAYLTIFFNEHWVNENFTKGNWYVIYPIATAFLFSLIHGAFVSKLLDILGIKEKK